MKKRYNLELTKGELRAIDDSLAYFFVFSGQEEIMQLFGNNISLKTAGKRAFDKVEKLLIPDPKEPKHETQTTN